MAKLILKSFMCTETTSGIGSDSPYFLFFVGGLQPNRQSKVVRIRLGSWHDEVDSGEFWPVNQTVVDNFDLDVAVCALIEEDGSGADIGGWVQVALEAYMKGRFDLLTTNQTTVSGAAKIELAENFRDKLKSFLGNDDLIRVKVIPKVNTLPGEITRLFNGDGAAYTATFRVEN